MFAGNDPCIESASGIQVAPFNFAYPLLDKHCQMAGLNIAENHWDLIHDFTKREDG